MDAAVGLFSLIDAIGILVPGGLATVCLHYCGFNIMLPVKNLFGDNDFMTIVCFFGLSFLLGCALHTISSALKTLYKIYRKDEAPTDAEKNAYKKIFGIDAPTSRRELLESVIPYVQREKRPPLFVSYSAYSTMSRTLSATFILLDVVFFFYLQSDCKCLILLAFLVAGIVFGIRWQHFDNLRINAASTIFISEVNSQHNNS